MFYHKAILQGYLEVSVDDTVLLELADSSNPHFVAQISNMFQGPEGSTAHMIWYGMAANMVLGWTKDEMEIFGWPHCQDGPLLSISQRCQVRQEPPAQGVEDDGVNF